MVGTKLCRKVTLGPGVKTSALDATVVHCKSKQSNLLNEMI